MVMELGDFEEPKGHSEVALRGGRVVISDLSWLRIPTKIPWKSVKCWISSHKSEVIGQMEIDRGGEWPPAILGSTMTGLMKLCLDLR